MKHFLQSFIFFLSTFFPWVDSRPIVIIILTYDTEVVGKTAQRVLCLHARNGHHRLSEITSSTAEGLRQVLGHHKHKSWRIRNMAIYAAMVG